MRNKANSSLSISVNAMETCSVLCHGRGKGNGKVTKYTVSEEERSGKPRKSNSKNRSGEDILPRTEKTLKWREQGLRLNFGELCRVVHFG